MNETLNLIYQRRSVRAYEDKSVPAEVKQSIIDAAMRAPTAGNMMLYSMIDITDQAIKDRLAETCDNQPFIAKAPLVLMFFADYQRWYDYFKVCGMTTALGISENEIRTPEEGDLLLACCDALIAAQNAVVAAEALGLGSCYIGDIMENYEVHRELLNLPDYVFPISMVVFGYPTEQQKERQQPERFDKSFIVFENKYKQLNKAEFDEMYAKTHERIKSFNNGKLEKSFGEMMYIKKYTADFTKELNRSVRIAMDKWRLKTEQ
ncbi:MAG: nitroreductase [Clostridiales bacterium GWB2_37_7]|nr:MAG: nitroreductase [Clostridiales bacterium GWB2_37_7]